MITLSNNSSYSFSSLVGKEYTMHTKVDLSDYTFIQGKKKKKILFHNETKYNKARKFTL